MKAGGTWGGTACSRSKRLGVRIVSPSAFLLSNQAVRAGPSTATSVEPKASPAR